MFQIFFCLYFFGCFVGFHWGLFHFFCFFLFPPFFLKNLDGLLWCCHNIGWRRSICYMLLTIQRIPVVFLIDVFKLGFLDKGSLERDVCLILNFTISFKDKKRNKSWNSNVVGQISRGQKNCPCWNTKSLLSPWKSESRTYKCWIIQVSFLFRGWCKSVSLKVLKSVRNLLNFARNVPKLTEILASAWLERTKSVIDQSQNLSVPSDFTNKLTQSEKMSKQIRCRWH